MLFVRGHSSAGRAPALQAGGRRFDPVWLHHFFANLQVTAEEFCEPSQTLGVA